MAFSLIIFHVRPHQDVSDFLTIRSLMAARAPDIRVGVLTHGEPVPDDFWTKMAARPTLIFSPFAIKIPDWIRGTRLISVAVPKTQELKILRGLGAPVLETRVITPTLQLDEKEWGPFTVVKPDMGLLGGGVKLTRTKDVRWIDTRKLSEDDPRHDKLLLAQRYIDTGPYVRCYRVLSVLGRPVYCALSTALEKRQEFPPEGGEIPIAANNVARAITLVNEPAVIDLARALHAKARKLPLMAFDIIREERTGRLYVLEYNSAGFSWHLSSDHGRKQQKEFNLNYYAQFKALPTITEALIEATRKYAT
ncbi:MAG: hypothetical protein AB7F09_29105 [Parvibaculaceae bacterium]